MPKLTQRHLAQRHHDAAPPFLRQHLPNRRRRTFAHRGIQANAPGRAALGIQLSVIRRISSIYQRYCQWYIENLIKLHKAQLASDRMSCHSATANQVRLVLHTAAFWLMHGVRAAIPQTSPLAKAEFTTIRQRLIKIGARVIEHIARIRIHLPTSCPERALFRAVALRLMPSGP